MTPCPWRTPTELWWSEVDLAEIDVVAYDLVDAMKTHEEQCPDCQAQSYGCTVVRDLLEEVVRWRDRRLLHAKLHMLTEEVDL